MTDIQFELYVNIRQFITEYDFPPEDIKKVFNDVYNSDFKNLFKSKHHDSATLSARLGVLRELTEDTVFFTENLDKLKVLYKERLINDYSKNLIDSLFNVANKLDTL